MIKRILHACTRLAKKRAFALQPRAGLKYRARAVLKIGAYFLDADMTFIMFSLVGIVGSFLSVLYFGLVHWIWLITVK